jgi:hypothetical protein
MRDGGGGGRVERVCKGVLYVYSGLQDARQMSQSYQPIQWWHVSIAMWSFEVNDSVNGAVMFGSGRLGVHQQV